MNKVTFNDLKNRSKRTESPFYLLIDLKNNTPGIVPKELHKVAKAIFKNA